MADNQNDQFTGQNEDESGPDQQQNTGTGSRDIGSEALSHALSISFRFLIIGMVILVVIYLLQGLFVVGRDKLAVKLCFGRPVKLNLGADRGRGYVLDSESGWRYCWPWEEVVYISLQEQTLKLQKDLWPSSNQPASQSGPGQGLNVKQDNYLITGDANIIGIQLQAKYRVKREDAMDYAFRWCRSTDEEDSEPVRDMLRRMLIETAIETVGTWDVLSVRSKSKTIPGPEGGRKVKLNLFRVMEDKLEEKLRKFEELNGFSLGVQVTSIEPVEDPEVPPAARQAFVMAVDAESEKDRLLEEAHREANRIVQQAEGLATEIEAEASTFSSRLVASARGDSKALMNLLKVYKESPQKAAILRDWHYQRMIEELLGQAEGSFVLHRPAEGSKRELRLLLGKPMSKADEEEKNR
ncbi:MAG: SPFH domain-containing protein [Candidatus Brocadiia bacterium]